MAERIEEIPISLSSDYIGLCKPFISLLAAAVCCAGYLFFLPLAPESLGIGFGAFLLSCGSGILNNCQDRTLDIKHRRTAHRPMANNRIPLTNAILISCVFILLGCIVLFVISRSFFAISVGLACIFVYNGIYTPLKKRFSLAFVPGALCGFLATYLGWAAAGGRIPSRSFFLFLFIIVIWQFPHYFLIGMTHKEDFTKSKTPNIFQKFIIAALEKWTALWILSYACLTLTLYFAGPSLSEIGTFVLLLNGSGLIISAIIFLSKKNRFKMYGLLRRQLVLSQAAVTLLMITQS